MRAIFIVAFAVLASASFSAHALAGGGAPAPKAGGIYDDGLKPVPKAGGVYDDGVKPAPKAGGNTRGGVFDDSTKPAQKPAR
jgi:hypothetical protein